MKSAGLLSEKERCVTQVLHFYYEEEEGTVRHLPCGRRREESPILHRRRKEDGPALSFPPKRKGGGECFLEFVSKEKREDRGLLSSWEGERGRKTPRLISYIEGHSRSS